MLSYMREKKKKKSKPGCVLDRSFLVHLTCMFSVNMDLKGVSGLAERNDEQTN